MKRIRRKRKPRKFAAGGGNRKKSRNVISTHVQKRQPRSSQAPHSHITGQVAGAGTEGQLGVGSLTPNHQHQIPTATHMGNEAHDHPPMLPHNVEYPDGTVSSHTHQYMDLGGPENTWLEGSHGPDNPMLENVPGGAHLHVGGPYTDEGNDTSHHHVIHPSGAHGHHGPLNRKGGKLKKGKTYGRKMRPGGRAKPRPAKRRMVTGGRTKSRPPIRRNGRIRPKPPINAIPHPGQDLPPYVDPGLNRKGGKARRFQTGGTTYQNAGCRIHTSKYDCDAAAGCSWDFNNTCCH
jgi:hypothetical protein